MKVKKRMLLFLMLLTISSTMALAAPTNSVLGVTRKEQVKSNWCWAATAQMLGNYYGSTKTQYQISANVKGNTTNNSAAFTSELTKAIEYATGRNCAVTGVLSFSEMKSLVGDELTPLAIYVMGRYKWSLCSSWRI